MVLFQQYVSRSEYLFDQVHLRSVVDVDSVDCAYPSIVLDETDVSPEEVPLTFLVLYLLALLYGLLGLLDELSLHASLLDHSYQQLRVKDSLLLAIDLRKLVHIEVEPYNLTKFAGKHSIIYENVLLCTLLALGSLILVISFFIVHVYVLCLSWCHCCRTGLACLLLQFFFVLARLFLLSSWLVHFIV